jgi:hypothetical protein
MYRIDKFLEYYHSLRDIQTEISDGVWINAKPIPFSYGIFTKEYWRERRQRIKDAKAVKQGKAVAVTWEKGLE